MVVKLWKPMSENSDMGFVFFGPTNHEQQQGLVGMVHGVVEGLEEGVVLFFAVEFGEAEGFDAFDEDFGGGRLSFDEIDDLVEELLQGHGAGISGLSAAHELGLNVGRD